MAPRHGEPTAALLLLVLLHGCSAGTMSGPQQTRDGAAPQDMLLDAAAPGDAGAGDTNVDDSLGGGTTPDQAWTTPDQASEAGCQTSCATAGKNCGTIADGCGGLLDCGFCAPPETCHGGGTANVCGGSVAITWTDEIQSDGSKLGFNGFGVQQPIGNSVTPDDSNGANLSRVPNPATGDDSFAMRHFARFEPSARSQAGIYNDGNPAFGVLATSAKGIWVAQQWYFPEAFEGGQWINLWDWHSAVTHTGSRWDTCPGLMLASDGSMKVRWSWHGASNPDSALSSIALPVGRWFDIEMHYVWTAGKTTVTLWVDGEEALRQQDVQTKDSSHTLVQTYIKLYGAGDWTPKPTIKYTRNVRIAGERITRPTPP